MDSISFGPENRDLQVGQNYGPIHLTPGELSVHARPSIHADDRQAQNVQRPRRSHSYLSPLPVTPILSIAETFSTSFTDGAPNRLVGLP